MPIAWVGMRAVGNSAIMYFVVWVVIGNFVLLALFLAILINNFQEEPTQSAEEVEEELARENMYGSDSASTSYAPSASDGGLSGHPSQVRASCSSLA